MIYIDTCDKGYMIFDGKTGSDKYSVNFLGKDTVLTQSPLIKSYCEKNHIQCNFLSSYLGLEDGLGLYEVFSYFFDGKVTDDFVMLQAIMNGLIQDSAWCFCLKVGVTFCWFTLDSNKIIKLGTLQFSESVSKYSIGKFMKRLRFNIAMSGINLNKVKYLAWEQQDLDNEFNRYILECTYLTDFFSKIQGLRGVDITGVMRLLSNAAIFKPKSGAEAFVDCLNEGFDKLGLQEREGVLYSNTSYYKDYSSCYSPIIDLHSCEYGIIIDCEGKEGATGDLKEGCREVGGIIYCRQKNILLNLDMFSCDECLLEDTLLQVIKNYRSIALQTGRTINLLCFGSSDSVMLQSSIDSVCSKKNRKMFNQTFKYIDCYKKITDYMYLNDIKVDGKKNLPNIAKVMGVLTVAPRHKAINDARTLFNILAKILQEDGGFICGN